MYVSFDQTGIIRAVSDHPVQVPGLTTEKVKGRFWPKRIGTPFRAPVVKKSKDLRVAVVCNWNSPCGISTYSKFLVDALRPKVKEIHIFSEIENHPTEADGLDVTRCWKRGTPMRHAARQILDWKPDLVITQHEFGIFPNATYFLQYLEMMNSVRHLMVMHSVYEHLDKTICTAQVKNMVVHNPHAEAVLRERGHRNNVHYIPHGCFEFGDVKELWNIFRTPYVVMQFGFGFYYKGVDRALEAMALMKQRQPEKYRDLFYCYLCSENPHNSFVHDEYYHHLLAKAKALGIEDNVAIMRGYHSEEILNNYLRTAKIAIFPYVNSSDNTVYGASGAARLAMANKIPVIVSESHLFDDLAGTLPRIDSAESLATEIDEIFSNGLYRAAMLEKSEKYCQDNNWNVTADRYLALYPECK